MSGTDRSKIFESPEAAVADVPDGASVLIGGFGVLHGWPSSTILALRDHGAKRLTVIANTPGFGPMSPQVLAENDQVAKLIGSFGGFPYRMTPMEERIG
ncbi:MAG: 3-oxoacid CoA-transferase, partial [Candidatus Binatota bacterium]|nr:3-oxoacid CoA-transferase [Candidatus Binatota bacterium]